MGQPPPVASNSQFYQPTPTVYAMRPASALQPLPAVQSNSTQPYIAAAGVKSPYPSHQQYPPSSHGLDYPTTAAAYSHPQWQHPPQHLYPNHAPSMSENAVAQRMQPPSGLTPASAYAMQQQRAMQRRQGGYQPPTATAQPPSMVPPASTPFQPHAQSLASPVSQLRGGKGAHHPSPIIHPSVGRPSHPSQGLGGMPTLVGQQLSAPYPPDSIEAMALSPLVLKRKRPKIYARDLTQASIRISLKYKVFGNMSIC